MIKCAGVNENKLSFNHFKKLFIEECLMLGTIRWVSGNNLILVALVEGEGEK